MLLRAGYRFSAAPNKVKYIHLEEKNSKIHMEDKIPYLAKSVLRENTVLEVPQDLSQNYSTEP